MARFLFRDRVRDELQGIGGARVFRDRVIIQVDEAGDRIKGDVLEDRAKALGGRVDLRFGRFRKPDHLGIASALEVEHAIVAPAMLIVPDETARWVRGERRFPSATQAEEQRYII